MMRSLLSPCGTISKTINRVQSRRSYPASLFPIRQFSGKRDDKNDQASIEKSSSLLVAQEIAPGLALSVATSAAGFQVASVLSNALSIPVSGIPVSILLGITIKNTVGYSNQLYKPGITYSTKRVLQGGIVAVAAKLSFLELLTTGSTGIPVVLSSLAAGMLFIPAAGRLAGLAPDMTYLLTVGTSICGVTAITALAPAINASNRATAVAVANTVAFGTVGMLVYPYLFHYACASPEHVGLCLGVAIHDTSQVLGSAMAYKESFGSDQALEVAAVTKLTRNLGLAFCLPYLTMAHQRASAEGVEIKVEATKNSKIPETLSGLNSFQQYVPGFLIAFIGMSALRSTGDYVLGNDVEIYNTIMNYIGNDVSKYALGTAMAGVGLSTSKDSLEGVGWKPFAVGGAGTVVVGVTGFTVASFLV